MTETERQHARFEVIKTYYSKLDAQDATLLDLFSDDVALFFPKYGSSRGKTELGNLGKRLVRQVERFKHDIDNFRYICQGDVMVIEGGVKGVMQNGDRFPVGDEEFNLFCTVFEFDGDLISRMHIYIDPDYSHEDTRRLANYSRSHKVSEAFKPALDE
ncbi:ketosteroid isomerase [Chimaeribacter arupi]|uniref:Ketosteroid isomerase n=2 Tax=Yersiniaceae TaxID=1903411 RepID=A0A2N5ESE8_9GAMM|nr:MULTISPECIES: nuclear transport factor 2 family protein [Yersiniaceae]MBS0971390.1 nuclear transport factor 2 family protein [Nissabacter archeti]MDV5139069.1 nuclear transport factor 2 family protein [Chimaeribacter arupi]PLR31943.1 ketosteroid isomerase [Chimaeribacter arupi]PLR45352.1 ketosteroid isomerase [Chimaeribacter arupi]PLR46027.1 ketosteroid isomerase [Chimaeribacter arupi]